MEKRQGTLTCIPYPDNSFDITYTAEALEHAICLENAVKELLRVTKPGGKVVVVDKNLGAKGALETEEWERWFDDAFFEKMAEENGCGLTVRGRTACLAAGYSISLNSNCVREPLRSRTVSLCCFSPVSLLYVP